jgi:hypothetical protein
MLYHNIGGIEVMRNKVQILLVTGLLMISVNQLTIDILECQDVDTGIGGDGNYDLKLIIQSDRHVAPHIYSEGVNAHFIVWIINQGPDVSEECNVTCTITKLFQVGQKPELVHNIEWTEQSLTFQSGHGTDIKFDCPIITPEPNLLGQLFAIFKIQATIDINDNNPEDNTDTLRFIVVWTGWIPR